MIVDLTQSWADALEATGIPDLECDAEELEEMRKLKLITDVAARGKAEVMWKLVRLRNVRIRDAGRALLDARCRPPCFLEYQAFAKEDPDAQIETDIYSVGTQIIGDSHRNSVKIPCFSHVDLTSAGGGIQRCMRWVLFRNRNTRVSITVLGIKLLRT